MTNNKTADTGTREPPVIPTAHSKVRVAGEKKPKRDVEVVSLEIADDDFGGDPYNHTGTHCVLKIDENA